MTLAEFKNIFLSIILCNIGFSAYAMPSGGMGSMGGAPGMPQDPQAMMQELEKAAQEIDSFVKSLPEKEQQEFYQMVEKIENKIQHKVETEGEEGLANLLSNPQEFEKFMEEVSHDVIVPTQPTPVEVAKEVKPVKKSVKPVAQKSKEEETADLLNTIAKETNIFLVKVQAMPELASKVARWGKTKRIYDWQPGLNWQDVKTEIEKLSHKVKTLTDKDPKNNTYKYIADLLKEESVYNNFSKLKTSLVEYVAQIEVSPFGVEKMTKSSKTALQRAISSYTEALYRLKLPEAIDAIIAKYEPRAQELRTQEEEAKKRAEQEAKRPRVPGRVEVAGQPENGFGGGGYYPSQDYDYSTGYGRGYSPDYGYRSGGYKPSYAGGQEQPMSSSTEQTGATTPIGKKAATKTKEEKTKSEKSVAKKDEKKDKTAEAKAPKIDKTDVIIQEMIKNIDTSLEQAAKAINAESNLFEVDTYVKKSVTPDAMQQDAQALMKLYKDQFAENDDLISLANAGIDLEKLQAKTKSFTTLKKKGIQGQLTKILSKNVRTKKGMHISIKETLDQFAQKVDNLEKAINDGSIQVPAYKRYLLINAAVENPATIEEKEVLDLVKQEIPKPVSLYDIRDVIKKIEKIITDFAQEPKRNQRLRHRA